MSVVEIFVAIALVFGMVIFVVIATVFVPVDKVRNEGNDEDSQ